VKLHQVVKQTWQRTGDNPTLPDLKNEVVGESKSIQSGISAIQSEAIEKIARVDGSAEMSVELVLACRHLKRIALLMEAIPEELHAFDAQQSPVMTS